MYYYNLLKLLRSFSSYSSYFMIFYTIASFNLYIPSFIRSVGTVISLLWIATQKNITIWYNLYNTHKEKWNIYNFRQFNYERIHFHLSNCNNIVYQSDNYEERKYYTHHYIEYCCPHFLHYCLSPLIKLTRYKCP
jgi:hypothetical protein